MRPEAAASIAARCVPWNIGTVRGQDTLSWEREIAAFVTTLLLMLWPIAVNGGPFYSEDSASYLRGGQFGFDTGLLMLDGWWHSLVGNARAPAPHGIPQLIVAEAIAQAGGVRSIVYSLATYVLRGPGDSLIWLAVFQAAAVALVISMLRRLVAPNAGFGASIAAGACIALLTSAPWYAAYVTPDILAGVGIAAAVALTIFFERTSTVLRIVLVLLIAYCVTTHSSHVLIISSVILAGAVASLRLHRSSFSAGKALWFVSPIAIAVATLLAMSYLAFGELSLAPKRYPIQLARSVADGPGARYLRDHCASERYAICEIYGTNPPRDAGEFLWGPNGVRYRATPEQMERIRAEESAIVRGAALEYPVEQIRRSLSNASLQFVSFGTRKLVFGEVMIGGADPVTKRISPDRPALKLAGTVIVYASFIASIALLIAFRRRLSRSDKAALAVVLFGLLANAAVCGILSAVTDRYQGRVAWVLPTLALMMLLRSREDNRPVATSAKVTLA